MKIKKEEEDAVMSKGEKNGRRVKPISSSSSKNGNSI